jgi:hypothetical protein
MEKIQTSVAAEQTTNNDGRGLQVNSPDIKRFTVELDMTNKELKLYIDGKTNDFTTNQNAYALEKLFFTLLTTVKQKINFWRTN